ncbi:MAG: N-acetyltransferase [Chloroflexi bacterium]|nr:MAG: N-acetyltransferase [Chloroflexota bacterium]
MQVQTVAIQIVAMTADHWPAVAEIYRQGIATGNATFAAAPPASWEVWCAGKINACSLVALVKQGADAELRERVAGWAALSPTSTRAVYAGVAEVSVYVAAAQQGQGIGDRLLAALIARSEAQGIWTLQAGIFPENHASLRLHAKHGFRQVGLRQWLGKMEYGPRAGEWRDVLLLERRSQVAGR